MPATTSSHHKAAAVLLLLAATAASVHGFLTPAAAPRAQRAPLAGPRRAAFIEVEKSTGGGSGEEDESGGQNGRGPGGRATVITERAWNASTLGALPTDLEGLSKAVSKCVFGYGLLSVPVRGSCGVYEAAAPHLLSSPS